MRFLPVIFFAFFIAHAYSQQLRVVGYTKYASIKHGRSLKDGDTLSVHNKVIIKQDGELHLINKTGWGFYLTKGIYDLDSCYHVYHTIYRDYDSVKAIIDTIFPNGLIGKFYTECAAMNSGMGDKEDMNFKSRNITFSNRNQRGLITAFSDTVTLYWIDPKTISGRYIIEFQDMFDAYVGYRICTGSSMLININDFSGGKDKLTDLIATVYSEDGRKSEKIEIVIKQ